MTYMEQQKKILHGPISVAKIASKSLAWADDKPPEFAAKCLEWAHFCIQDVLPKALMGPAWSP